MKNAIGWCDTTWNPVTGCTPVSLACDHCYAKRMAHRLAGRYGYPADEPFRVTLHPDRLYEPLRWRKPRRVFVCSMGDLFHEDVPVEFIAHVFGIMALTCPDSWILGGGRPIPIGEHHTFQILTKRPDRMRDILTSDGFPEFIGSLCGVEPLMPMPHVWLGTTVENQYWADERIPILRETPAAVRFVSVEPILGPVYLDSHQGGTGHEAADLDWCICGGESGPGARPADPAWFRSLRDQCAVAEVPFFLKDKPGTIDGVAYREFPAVAP